MATSATISEEYCFSWTTNKTNGNASPPFKIKELNLQLCFDNFRHSTYDYSLRLTGYNISSEPLDLMVYFFIGEDIVSHNRATVRIGNSFIWKGIKSDLSKVVPDFEKLPFRFKVVVSGSATQKRGEKSVQTPDYLDNKVVSDPLCQDFARLFDEDSGKDVEIVCGDRTWKAHEILLGIRSDVFKAMLQSDMLEGKTRRIEIRDTEPQFFEQFLRYLYTGKVSELTVDSAMILYKIGDQYPVGGIKETCASFLMENLTRENACVVLSFAERHSDEELKECVIAYILDEKIPMYGNLWSDFCNEYPELANVIYGRFVKTLIFQ